MTFHFSVSSVRKYMECPASYAYRYVNRWRVKGQRLGARDIGSAVHAGLASLLAATWEGIEDLDPATGVYAWGKANEPDFSLQDEYGQVYVDAAEWDDLLQRAIAIVDRFWTYLDFSNHYEVVTLRGEPAIEHNISHSFEILGLPVEAIGVIDAIVRDKATGAIEIWDFKVSQKFNGFEYYQTNMQLPLYMRLIELVYGLEAQSASIYQIRSNTPQEPKRNKSDELGKMVSRANITTDWATYKATVLMYGDDPALYEDVRLKLAAAGDHWYEKMEYVYSTETLNLFWENFLNAAREIVRAQTEPGRTFPHVFGFACTRCEYRTLCNAKIAGDPLVGLFDEVDGKYFVREDEIE